MSDCMKIVSFILNLASVRSVWPCFGFVVEEAVNNPPLSTLSCHSLVYSPKTPLFLSLKGSCLFNPAFNWSCSNNFNETIAIF